MKKSGVDFQVSSSVIIKGLEKLSVGNNCYLAPFVIINCSDDIILSDQVMIGFSSVIVSGNHSKINGSYRYGYRNTSPINIKYGVWVGANCTILAGAEIGRGSLIAANSVVNNVKCKSDSIYGGVPCKFIKNGN
ncbi:acyltransferase [Photobacterium damselae subsp. damselae]|uniref:acyltransferase n=1 Tax=Photobacterium damselae TaxID=38293 RepID=UPI001495BE80|nr:acyltransferase [Photobacterium damselae]QSH58007.1 acyltransferase [Photobacterium damselae subsp. damselae]